MRDLTTIIQSDDPALRDLDLEPLCEALDLDTLLSQCDQLDRFRRDSDNLYERVRALFFLYAIHRFHLPRKLTSNAEAAHRGSRLIPFKGYGFPLHIKGPNLDQRSFFLLIHTGLHRCRFCAIEQEFKINFSRR